MATANETISQLYVGYFNRAPDPAGLQFWVNQLNNGTPFSEIADYFSTAPEALAQYPYLREPALNSVDSFITEIYGNLFNRAPDAEGLAFWKGKLESGEISTGEFIATIANTAAGPDRLVLDNKVAVGVYFAAELSQNNVVWDAASDAAAHSALQGVTEDPNSVIEAKGEVDYFIDNGAWPGTDGETFVLRAGNPGPYNGTAGNDIFQGILDGADSTFQTFDQIDGKGGVNTFQLVVGATNQTLPISTSVSNIQIVELNQTAGGIVNNLSTAGFGSSVQALWQIGTAGDVTLSAIGQTAGFDGSNLAEVKAGSGVDAVSVALKSVLANEVLSFGETADGSLKAVTVDGSVAGNGAVTIDTATNTTAVETIELGLTKNGVVTLQVDNDVVTTVDASASTGNLTIDASALNALESLIGGSGRDALTVQVDATTAKVLDVAGGAGNDTLTVTVTAAAAGSTGLWGNEGSDKFVIDSVGVGNIASASKFADSLITIQDFDAKSDVLDLNLGIVKYSFNNQQLTNIGEASSLADALNVAASYITDGQYAIFDYAGDAYVLSDLTDGATFSDGDGLIKIAGASASDFNSANLV